MILAKNKSKLLKLFFSSPDKSFYMQEIGRILHKKPGVFQKTLNNLEKEITGDIVQGLPRIEEILEARKKNLITKQ